MAQKKTCLFVIPAPDDYAALLMENVLFEPAGPLTECVNISIIRDFLVEFDEMFSFNISPNQADPAVQVGSPDALSISILDEDGGKLHRCTGNLN